MLLRTSAAEARLAPSESISRLVLLSQLPSAHAPVLTYLLIYSLYLGRPPASLRCQQDSSMQSRTHKLNVLHSALTIKFVSMLASNSPRPFHDAIIVTLDQTLPRPRGWD